MRQAAVQHMHGGVLRGQQRLPLQPFRNTALLTHAGKEHQHVANVGGQCFAHRAGDDGFESLIGPSWMRVSCP